MVDQTKAIERLLSKQSLKSRGEELLEYIMHKILFSRNKRARYIWREKFNNIFDALPKAEQKTIADGVQERLNK